jgi:hypothetical protein
MSSKVPETSPSWKTLFIAPDPTCLQWAFDLYYMPIMEMAALSRPELLRTDVVGGIHRSSRRMDPTRYYGVLLFIFDRSPRDRSQSAINPFADGTYLFMMCIPFGVSDHHQIDDESTMYGSTVYNNVQTTKSTL